MQDRTEGKTDGNTGIDKRAAGQSQGQSGVGGQKNEGEGNRTAAREYNRDQQAFVKSGKVERKAREAEDAIDSDEGDELREAERKGKSHSHGEDPGLNPGLKARPREDDE